MYNMLTEIFEPMPMNDGGARVFCGLRFRAIYGIVVLREKVKRMSHINHLKSISA